MTAAGIRVALGTDSRASNPDLSVLNELRLVRTIFPAIPPADMVRMASLDGAEALGLADQVGSLTVGKLADLAAVPVDPASSDPYQALLDSTSEPQHVWIGGQKVTLSA